MPQRPFPSEDKLVLKAREPLLQRWRTGLTDDQRAAWLDFWSLHPPSDIFLRKYFPGPARTLDESTVPAEVAYAWSQLFATYRFNDEPTDVPPTWTDYTLSIEPVNSTIAALAVAVSCTPAPPTPTRVLFFASPQFVIPGNAPRQSCRYIGKLTLDTWPAQILIGDSYLNRFDASVSPFLAVTFAIIVNGNLLTPCRDTLIIELEQ